MGFQDRRYNENVGRGGGFSRALRRLAVGEDSFFSWAVPLFTAFRIRVRVHLLFILFAAVQLIQSMRSDWISFGYQAYAIAALFIVVLLHEFGHCFACRWAGGEADRILMWPLGGLASTSPPNHWKAHLITTAGGPAVNVLLLPVFGAMVVGVGVDWHALLSNPFDPYRAIVVAGITTHTERLVFWLYQMNLMLLMFNVLLPMYPLDGARLLQEVLWKYVGYERSMSISVNLGLVVAVIVGLYALTTPGNSILLGVAIFAGFMCVNERRNLQFMRDAGEFAPSYATAARAAAVPPRRDARAEKRAVREAAREAAEQAEIDRILEKIAREGMGRLTSRERRTLEQATERKRRG
ncbi:MAG: hypothetical protein KF745_09975 [Phycisphaeraceae bacterium]|nr:hypothetical protein [Phycisphaeraceae bacterium]